MKKRIKTYHRSIFNALATGLILLVGACSKNEDPNPELPPLPEATVTASGTYIINDLVGDLGTTMDGKSMEGDGGFKTIYYSLEDGRVIPAEYANTDKWDIAFAGIYNSSIWANHGEVKYEGGGGNPGYGSPARGMFYLVVDSAIDRRYYNFDTHKVTKLPIPMSYLDEAFDNVTKVPVDDSKFNFYGNLGLDHFLASGDGYAFYDFYGTMYPGNTKKTHVVYNLARPFIIKTAKNNYAKVIFYSFYKGKPENPDRDNVAPYLSFKYTILKDGSKDFSVLNK